MPHEATLSRTWKNRMYMIIAFCVAVGAWFFYDGAFGFPKKNEAFLAHQQLEAENRTGEWPELARSRGWKAKPPEKLYERTDLIGQFVLGGLSTALGLAAAVWLALCWNRRLRSDEEAVYGDTGKRVPFSEMRSVDKRKWDSKGIAVVIYDRGGKKKKLVIDDYKYAGGEDILQEVETRLEQQQA